MTKETLLDYVRGFLMDTNDTKITIFNSNGQPDGWRLDVGLHAPIPTSREFLVPDVKVD